MNKRHLLLATFALAATAATGYAQNTPWPASGNVGIGTTRPDAPLHVSSAGEPQVRLQSSGHEWAILTNPYWANNGFSIYDITGGVSRLQVTTGGNVGIGVIYPSMKLEVAGAMAFGDRLYKSTCSPGDVDPVLISAQSEWSAGEIPIISLGFEQGLGGGADMDTKIWSYARTPQESRSFVAIGRNRIDFGAPAASFSGNVGIGTAAPVADLHVGKTGTMALDRGWYYGAITDASSRIHFGWDWPDASTGNRTIVQEATGATQICLTTNRGIQLLGGNVGIGTTSPTEKLSVKGKIRAQEVIVETTGWSDYVFAKDYKLAPLSEVEQHIEQQGHLPGVPSAQEVAEKGVSLGDMQAILLAKIEELTLHQIALEKLVRAQAEEIETLKIKTARK